MPNTYAIAEASGGALAITIHADSVEEAKAVLDARQYRVAMQAAISRTLTSGRAAVARLIVKELPLKIADVKELIKVERPSFDKLEGSLKLSRKPIPIIDFKPRQTKAGVSVLVRKSRGRQLLTGAFIATMRTGHIGVFERRGKSNAKRDHSRPRVGRLKIDERMGLTAAGYLGGEPAALDEATSTLNDAFEKNVESQIQRVIFNRRSTAKFDTVE